MKEKFNNLHKTQQAVVVALALSLSFACMGIWIRMMGDGFDDFQQSYLRILGAGLIALVVFRKRRTKKLFSSLSKKEWSIYSIRAIVAYVFGIALYTIAIQNADLSTVAFMGSIPLVGLLAFIMFREKLPLASIPFITLSVVGVFLLTGASLTDFRLGVGEIATLVSAVAFDIGFLMSRMHRKERNNYDNTTILLLIGWIPVFIISLALHESILPKDVTLVALCGLILSSAFNVLGLYATNYVFTNLKAYVAGNILLMEVIWATLIGLIIYSEPVTLMIAAGGMLILASALAINKIDNRNEAIHNSQVEESEKVS